MTQPAPDAEQTPTDRRRSRAVVALAVLSSVLAVALLAVSLAWWTQRDGAGADADSGEAATTTAPGSSAPPAGGSGADVPPAGDGDGSWHPGPTPGEIEVPTPTEDDGGPLRETLERLFGGSLGDAADQLGGLSPECLDGSLWDLLDGLGGGAQLGGSLAEQVRQIAATVEEQRGLAFTEPIEPQLVPADEFDEQVAGLFADEYTADDADLDERVLTLLGAVPDGTDLRETQIDLLSGQVAGYYDPDTGDIVVRDDGDGELDATERVTLAHELDHALTDQALGLPGTEVDGDSDAVLARLGLVEGDATLLMQQWSLANLGLTDQLGQLLDPEVAAAQAELDHIAPYLRQELVFPYLSGLAYACRLFADGGWSSVDAAYDASALPATTAEVLFDDWTEGELADPVDPGRLPSPWTVARRDTIGAAQLWWLFSAPGGVEDAAVPDARQLASRWAGGEVVLSIDGERSALGVSLVDRADGHGLCDAVDGWYAASSADDERVVEGSTVVYSSPDRVAVLTCSGRDVRLGIGPDRAAAVALVD